ncbi:MAG: sigma-70 family RNA polymerase sigma factor [Verrucomicrobia bacterium]|nr:sigma-70 family RNA polymerase sigma factor [Cytophagales bacterium]
MPEVQELIPHLFRTEFRKIVSVLAKVFGLEHIETAEDIVSDTFLLAAETWRMKGLPENPTAWLYTVAKNKAKDYLKRDRLFNQKIAVELQYASADGYETAIDLSDKNITDSQLQMMFALCHPAIPVQAQIGLSLRILCGLGIEEIADAFLSSKETINKRLFRAKEKLREEKISMELPPPTEIHKRLESVLRTLYLLFNEGYYSSTQHTALRKDLCLTAMRLNLLLVENATTNQPLVNALLALMCFHASRFEARQHANGEIILYAEQNEELWDKELIKRGEYYLQQAATGNQLSKYHLEAAIAYWHTQKTDTREKWENILQLYNRLLQLEYSPVAALNRTFALAKVEDKPTAIVEALKLDLNENHLYHALLANLYTEIDNQKAIEHLQMALKSTKTVSDQLTIHAKITQLIDLLP